MRRLLLASTLLTLGLAPLSAHAQVETYKFDKVHTQIFFSVDHLGYTQSTGQFLDFDGGFTFDRTAPEKSNVNVTIKTDSINMNDEKWDAHLKTADFFDVAKFHEMTFKSTAIEKTGEKTANIKGDLTLLGVTKPVTLATTFNKADKHPMADEYHAGFNAEATIKRSDFGMKFGLPAVGDDVKIHINVEGVREDGTDTGTKNK
jgi:polyisoprenoid-binding protein YceI